MRSYIDFAIGLSPAAAGLAVASDRFVLVSAMQYPERRAAIFFHAQSHAGLVSRIARIARE